MELSQLKSKISQPIKLQPHRPLPKLLHPPPDSKKTARPPTDYDGDIKKGDTWLRELYLYFREENFTDDKKITIALSYLQGGNTTVWRDRKTQELADWETAVANGQNPTPIFQDRKSTRLNSSHI